MENDTLWECSNILLFLQLLRPMMLRRMKEDVEKSLAPKEETIVEVKRPQLTLIMTFQTYVLLTFDTIYNKTKRN